MSNCPIKNLSANIYTKFCSPSMPVTSVFPRTSIVILYGEEIKGICDKDIDMSMLDTGVVKTNLSPSFNNVKSADSLCLNKSIDDIGFVTVNGSNASVGKVVVPSEFKLATK